MTLTSRSGTFKWVLRGVFVLGLLVSGGELFASEAVDLPVHHWSVGAIERLAAQGFCKGLGLGMRNLSRGWMAMRVAEALKAIDEGEAPDLSQELAYQTEEDLLRLSREFAHELKRLDVSIGEGRRRAGEPFHWKLLTVQTGLVSEAVLTSFEREASSSLIENSQGFRVQEGFNGRWRLPSWVSVGEWLAVTLDPSVRARKENSDTDLDFEEASVKVAYRNLELKAGDLNFWWGPGAHGELILSNNTRPLRAFSLRTRREFELPWKLDVLGKWQAQLIGAKLEEKRDVKEPLLTGTRFEWSPHRRVVLGASHTALFGGEGEEEDLGDFLSALNPTAGGGETERADHLFGADIRFFLPEPVRWGKLGTGFEVYGGFFGEDTTGFYVPRFTSLLGGFLITDLFSFPGLDFRFEGAKTDSIAYEHFVYRSGYRFKNEFIGHHAGADADDIFFRLAKEFSFEERRFIAGAQFDRERSGLSGSPLSFSQTALIKNEFQLDLAHEFTDTLEITAAYQFEDVNNFQGSSGVDSHNHIVTLQTRLRF